MALSSSARLPTRGPRGRSRQQVSPRGAAPLKVDYSQEREQEEGTPGDVEMSEGFAGAVIQGTPSSHRATVSRESRGPHVSACLLPLRS